MAVTTISRTAYNLMVDDDGSGNTGTVINKAMFDDVLDGVDNVLAANLVIGGTFTANGNVTANGASAGFFERGRSVAQGIWTDVAYNAANFAVVAPLTITMNATVFGYSTYMEIGKTMWWKVGLSGFTLGGANGSTLLLTIPNSRVAAHNFSLPFQSGHYPPLGWGNFWLPSCGSGSTLISVSTTTFSLVTGASNYFYGDFCFDFQ